MKDANKDDNGCIEYLESIVNAAKEDVWVLALEHEENDNSNDVLNIV